MTKRHDQVRRSRTYSLILLARKWTRKHHFIITTHMKRIEIWHQENSPFAGIDIWRYLKMLIDSIYSVAYTQRSVT